MKKKRLQEGLCLLKKKMIQILKKKRLPRSSVFIEEKKDKNIKKRDYQGGLCTQRSHPAQSLSTPWHHPFINISFQKGIRNILF